MGRSDGSRRCLPCFTLTSAISPHRRNLALWFGSRQPPQGHKHGLLAAKAQQPVPSRLASPHRGESLRQACPPSEKLGTSNRGANRLSGKRPRAPRRRPPETPRGQSTANLPPPGRTGSDDRRSPSAHGAPTSRPTPLSPLSANVRPWKPPCAVDPNNANPQKATGGASHAQNLRNGAVNRTTPTLRRSVQWFAARPIPSLPLIHSRACRRSLHPTLCRVIIFNGFKRFNGTKSDPPSPNRPRSLAIRAQEVWPSVDLAEHPREHPRGLAICQKPMVPKRSVLLWISFCGSAATHSSFCHCQQIPTLLLESFRSPHCQKICPFVGFKRSGHLWISQNTQEVWPSVDNSADRPVRHQIFSND